MAMGHNAFQWTPMIILTTWMWARLLWCLRGQLLTDSPYRILSDPVGHASGPPFMAKAILTIGKKPGR